MRQGCDFGDEWDARTAAFPSGSDTEAPGTESRRKEVEATWKTGCEACGRVEAAPGADLSCVTLAYTLRISLPLNEMGHGFASESGSIDYSLSIPGLQRLRGLSLVLLWPVHFTPGPDPTR